MHLSIPYPAVRAGFASASISHREITECRLEETGRQPEILGLDRSVRSNTSESLPPESLNQIQTINVRLWLLADIMCPPAERPLSGVKQT